MEVRPSLRYTKEHEWVRQDADGLLTVGITDYAQNSLGDVTFVDLPKLGASFPAGGVFGVVESVKAASDLYLPVAGEVVERNEDLVRAPEWVNQSPYDKAWMIRLKPADPGSFGVLLDADAYAKITL